MRITVPYSLAAHARWMGRDRPRMEDPYRAVELPGHPGLWFIRHVRIIAHTWHDPHPVIYIDASPAEAPPRSGLQLVAGAAPR